MSRQGKVLSVCAGMMGDRAAKARSRGTAGIALAAILAVWAALGAAPAAADGPMVLPGASLLETDMRVHPDASLLLGAPSTFNIFTDAAMPPGWELEVSHSGTPSSGVLDVVILSQAWRHIDGHLLFAYQVQNLAESTAALRVGNLVGYGPDCEVIDSGILDLGGDVEFDQGDVLRLRRSNGSEPQLRFAFEATGGMGETIRRALAPGQTSSWFYAETLETNLGYSMATVQDGSQTAEGMEVLGPLYIPVPEPATIGLMGAGMAALGLLRRRRRVA